MSRYTLMPEKSRRSPGRPRLPWSSGQVAGELALVVGKDRRQGRARNFAQSMQVNATHET